jgi:hypothetical protein
MVKNMHRFWEVNIREHDYNIPQIAQIGCVCGACILATEGLEIEVGETTDDELMTRIPDLGKKIKRKRLNMDHP